MSVTDIGCGRKACAVNEISLNITPNAVRHSEARIEQALPVVANADAGFPCPHLIIQKPPNKIAIDRKTAGAKAFLIAPVLGLFPPDPTQFDSCRICHDVENEIGQQGTGQHIHMGRQQGQSENALVVQHNLDAVSYTHLTLPTSDLV